MKFPSLILASACLFSAQSGVATPLAWTDSGSGRAYLLLNEPMSRGDAELACRDQGYALFDQRYVDAEEQQRILRESSLLDNLPWEIFYAGTPRETSLSRLWQSAQVGVIARNPSSVGSKTLVIQSRNGTISAAIEPFGGEGALAPAICMAVDTFWFSCNLEYKCTYDRDTNPYTIRYKFADYGATQGEAIRRITETTRSPEWSVSEGQCALQTESLMCTRVLP